MGMVKSDFFTDFDRIEVMEMPFTDKELEEMASDELRERLTQWFAGHGSEGYGDELYLPAELVMALFEDQAFWARFMMLADSGECLVISNAVQAYTSEHIARMGQTEEDVRQNVLLFYENSDMITDYINQILSGTDEWVTGLYVFANGWIGVETERPAGEEWNDEEPEQRDDDFDDRDPVSKPASSYLITAEGDLVATPDIRYDVSAWMDFVDMFSAINEEALAGDPNADRAEKKRKEEGSAEGDYIVFSEDVREAVQQGRPIVLIESAATFGGMIYPGIEEFAFKMQKTIRESGAVPAFTAILNGQIHIGLTPEEIMYLAKRYGSIPRATARDIPVLMAKHADGVMTIAATVQTAAVVKLPIVCGSGIGGVQLEAEKTWDVSTDLESLARHQVMVICSGTKPALDLPMTMEYLETSGVPVIGYRTDRMPEYMVRGSEFRLTYRMDEPEDLAEVMRIKKQMDIPGGVLIVNPVPEEFELGPERTRDAVEQAMEDAKRNRVAGRAAVGYVMGSIKDQLGEDSAESQKAFLINNAMLAAQLACAYQNGK